MSTEDISWPGFPQERDVCLFIMRCLLFYFPIKNILLTWKRHCCWWCNVILCMWCVIGLSPLIKPLNLMWMLGALKSYMYVHYSHPLPKDTAEGCKDYGALLGADSPWWLEVHGGCFTYRKSQTYVRKRERSTYMTLYVCFTKSSYLRVTLKVDRKSTSS